MPVEASSEARVTVLMPCGDVHAGFLREAVASVLAQSTPAWRLIVVQSGPPNPDRTTVVAELKASGDPRLSTVECAAPGVTAALNAGMRAAQTPFVCALHGDDLLPASAIEGLQAYLERYPEADYFHSSRIHIDQQGHPLSRLLPAKPVVTLADFRERSPVKHLHCWRVQAALAIGGMDESLGLHGGDDYDFPWCMAEAGCRFQAIPECLYYYRDHRAHVRLTTHVPLDRQIAELVRIFRKHGLSEGEIREQIRQRSRGYLRQALYRDERDQREKERAGFDIRTGWREPCE